MKVSMSLQYHPEPGTIVVCNFHGFVAPEMVKKRPAVVISPRLRNRGNLCTIVPCSTSEPPRISSYHFKLHVDPPLPSPYDSSFQRIKADMVYTVSFDRLTLPFKGKDSSGKRIYDVRVIDKSDLIKIQECVLHGIGLSRLTGYL
jgi:uncharacterized protein YifN (PemK superfamily)